MISKKGLGVLVIGSLAALLLTACEGGVDDPTAQLTGTEEQPLTTPGSGSGSAPTCGGGKVLICHIPPGNPANAHTICVGQPAVKAHVTHHGDGLGACGKSTSDAGVPPLPLPPPPIVTVDAGPVCLAMNAACTSSAQCCGGMVCDGTNVCYPLIQ